MKKLILIALVFLSLTCTQIIPTPNDFPMPPMTVIVEFPNYTSTPVFVPLLQPIANSDMPDAESFLLIIKTNMMAGNDQGIAERVLYPINVIVNGQSMTIRTKDEFIQNYEQIFNETLLNALTEIDEDGLVSGAEGIRVGNGELWFNLFCMDTTCTQKNFLITQINN